MTTKNGKLAGKPIVYAVTVLSAAPDAEWAAKYVAMLLGPEGQRIMEKNGFGTLSPAYAVNVSHMPENLRSLVSSWPEP